MEYAGYDRIDENASVMIGLRVLSKQVDRLDEGFKRIDEVRLPEIQRDVQEIRERLAGGFVTDEDCEKCRNRFEVGRALRRDIIFRTIPIVISIAALVAVYMK